MEVKLPELGDNVTQATVVGVLVKEGDRVEPGQPLLELETDKAVVEVPAEAGGVRLVRDDAPCAADQPYAAGRSGSA